jgi:hypothetical protein
MHKMDARSAALDGRKALVIASVALAILTVSYGGVARCGCLEADSHGPPHHALWSLGMAGGGCGAGVLYDHYGFCPPAFATGIVFNLVNLVILLSLVLRQRGL